MTDPTNQPLPLLWMLRIRLVLCLTLVELSTNPAFSQTPPPSSELTAIHTLVLFNPNFPGSADLAKYYADKRGIPQDQLIALPTTITDSISRADFDSQIRQPLQQILAERKWWTLADSPVGDAPLSSRVTSSSKHVLALMRGLPFRILPATAAAKPGEESEASVDSDLTLLSLEDLPPAGFIKNPFFKSPLGFENWNPLPGMMLVSRLDGPDDNTVRRLIDDALQAENDGLSGRAVIDLARKDGPYEQGEEWLRETSKLYRQHGIPSYVDRHADLIPDHWPLPDTILYFGWYRDHAAGALAQPSFQFMPGAIACHLHSFSAGQLRTLDKQWIAPLLQRGAAAALGNVWEPYLSLTTYLDFFNERLLAGATLTEAAWAATPGLSWMTLVIGDPLYRPFKSPLTSRLSLGPTRDFALFSGLVQRHPNTANSAEFRQQVQRLAQQRNQPLFIEFLALHTWQSGGTLEAATLLDHAADWYQSSKDQTRARLYQAEALRQLGQREAAKEALQSLSADPAAKALLQLLQ